MVDMKGWTLVKIAVFLSALVLSLGISALALPFASVTKYSLSSDTDTFAYVSWGFYRVQICGADNTVVVGGTTYAGCNDCVDTQFHYDDQPRDCGSYSNLQMTVCGKAIDLSGYSELTCMVMQGLAGSAVVCNGLGMIVATLSILFGSTVAAAVSSLLHVVAGVLYCASGFYVTDKASLDSYTHWGFSFIMLWLNGCILLLTFLINLAGMTQTWSSLESACDSSTKDPNSPMHSASETPTPVGSPDSKPATELVQPTADAGDINIQGSQVVKV